MNEPLNKSIEKKLAARTYLALLIVGLCSSIILTFLMLGNFEKILLPQFVLKSNVIANSVRSTVADALKLGIPFESLVGMNDYLSDTLVDNSEIEFIEVKSRSGHEYTLHRNGTNHRTSNGEILEVIAADDELPGVTIGLRGSYIQEKLQIMFGDAAVASLVALTVGFEILLFFVVIWVLRPMGTWVSMINGFKTGQSQRTLSRTALGPFSELITLTHQYFQSMTTWATQTHSKNADKDWYEPRAHDVRIVLFLFVFSEELLRSYFPIYVKEIALTNTWLTVDFAIALPIMSYMLFAGLGTLFGGAVIARLGLRNALKWSVIISTLGLGGLAFATTVTEVIALRSVCAIGYAIATVACQVYMAQTSKSDSDTTKGLSTFVAAITAGSLCGAPVGAVVAELIGINGAMLFASVIAFCSWLFFMNLKMPVVDNNDQQQSAGGFSTRKNFAELLKNRKILIILICDVASGKLMLASLLFYLTPMLLIQFQFSQTSIGQFFMFYYVPLTVGNMVISRLSPSHQSKMPIMMVGALLSGAGGLLLYWFNTPFGLAVAITCLGFGQSMVLTMTTSLMLALAKSEIPQVSAANTLALARTFDRIGGILGAALVASLSLLFDYRHTTVLIGGFVLLLSLGNIWLGFRSDAVKQVTIIK
jgi:predicted MFS family arabinose efflux permease